MKKLGVFFVVFVFFLFYISLFLYSPSGALPKAPASSSRSLSFSSCPSRR